MKNLKPSGWGLLVDKSKAIKTRKLRGTVFPKDSDLNMKCPKCGSTDISHDGGWFCCNAKGCVEIW